MLHYRLSPSFTNFKPSRMNNSTDNKINKSVALNPLRKEIYFLLLLSFSASIVFAQTMQVSGRIINEQNEPVIHATLHIKRTNKFFYSNDNGEFRITGLSANEIIQITSVGYELQEFNPEKLSMPVIIKLRRNVRELKQVEVVSSGYQDIPEERATGSFVTIDNNTLNQQAGTNILKRLEGVSSSLLFEIGKQNPLNSQSKLNITIRGLSTINGPLDPLVVLDGFIYEGNIGNINPNDIENVTILRDAAASSIWGARAGNGVIIITSKKGRYNQNVRIDVGSNITMSEKPDLNYLPQMKSADYIEVEQFLFNQGYFDNQINSNPYGSMSPAVEIFLKRRSGQISPADSASAIKQLANIDSRAEYLNYFYTKPVTQQYYINLRGGSDRNAYTFSAGYDHILGETFNKFDKLNIKVENSYQPGKNFRVTIGAYYTNSKSRSGRNQSYNSILTGGRAVPYLKFTDDIGKSVNIASQLNDNYTDTAGQGKLLDWKYYPLEDYKYNNTGTSLQELFAYTGVEYKFGRFLDINVKYQYQMQQTETQQISGVESFEARNIINRFSQLDRTTGVVTYIVPVGGIKRISNSGIHSKTLRGQLDFHNSWGSNDVNAIAGIELREANSDGGEYSIYGYNTDPLSSSIVDFVNYYPEFTSGGYSQIPGSPLPYKAITNRFISLYGNFSYTYKRRYVVSASARRDGSNVFGASTNNKWKPLWSVGGKWKISDEKFYNFDILPRLDFRVTYGYSGNVDLSKSAEAVAIYYSGAQVTNLPFASMNILNNPELRWEKVGMLNLGIDFSAKNNVISGSIEYYHKKGTDLYGNTPYDYTTWGRNNTIIKNVADMAGNGIDLILNTKNMDRRLKWTSGFLLSYTSSKTTKYLSTESSSIVSILGGGSTITPVVGKPLYAIAAYRWGRLDANGNPQGYLNGQLSTDYLSMQTALSDKGEKDGIIKFIGPTSPTVFGAVNNSVSFAKFTFSVNIIYKFGYYFRKSSVSSYAGIMNYGGGHKDYEKRWQSPGDEYITNVPSFIYPNDENRDAFYTFSEINVLKADNIRLQYINLSYDFQDMSKRTKANFNINLYLNISNIGIIWRANKEGLDPDYPASIKPPVNCTIGIRASF